MQRFHYEIKGMSCAACVAHVERAVGKVLTEKDSFTVSLLTSSVSILLAGELTDSERAAFEERLAASVRAAGYTLLSPTPERDARQNTEFRGRLVRLILSAFFTLAVMYLAMGPMLGLPVPSPLVQRPILMALSQLALTLPVLILNFKFFRGGFSALFHLSPNMDSLIAVGSGASVLYGLFAVGLMLFSESGAHSVHDLYFESAATILTLVSLGKLLESRAKDKAADAVRSLSTLSPRFATVLREGGEELIPVEEIRKGDLLLVRAGELLPVDGTVVSGTGSTDESALTGESMPVEKQEGSPIRAACVLSDGALTVRAEQVGEDTSLSRMIRLLEDAAASKAPIARIADRVSAVFVPCVMAVSLLTLVLWLLLTKDAEAALRASISVLVISCPCALGLATPTAITVGIGRGARNGILFRNAESLERLCHVRTAVLDKTGTVTEGKPSLTDAIAYGMDAETMLCSAAAVERLSSHPLAQAVRRAGEEMLGTLPECTDFQLLPSIGAQGRIDGRLCRVGKPDPTLWASLPSSAQGAEEAPSTTADASGTRLLSQKALSSLKADFEALERQGKTAVLVTLDERPVGILGIADRIRPEAREAVSALHALGVRCLMMTGDNERTAAFVAEQVSLDGFSAGLMPEDKERMVHALSEEAPVAMIGDGINDAPALLRADVGIAVGAGTEVAIDCAGVVLSGASLTGVADAISLSRATIRIIKQNLFWALFYNAICIPFAALGQLSPMLASAAMSFSSVCVVSNALRLRKIALHKNEIRKDNTENEVQDMLFGKKEEAVTTLSIEGMMCPRCVAHVREALSAVKGVSSVEVSLEEKSATVTGKASLDALRDAVTRAGYEVK
ncbi:MAG: heavy metal translocating P-type ATPase [Clostridia bacterium]|nr:heavy metal translocating P-type ATPase [Clostridia bacterium]